MIVKTAEGVGRNKCDNEGGGSLLYFQPHPSDKKMRSFRGLGLGIAEDGTWEKNGHCKKHGSKKWGFAFL